MPVDYLLYVSQARSDLTEADLEAILAESRAYNVRAGITGLLLFVPRRDGHGGSFMQMLEGDAADIDRLKERIFADRRHHTKVVLEKGRKDARDFGDWTMAFKHVSQAALDAYPHFRDMGNDDFLERCRKGEVDGACDFLVDFWNDAA